MWQRGLLKLIDFERWIHRNCLFLWNSDVFHYDFARRFASGGSMWQRGLLNLIVFEGWIHRNCLFLWSSDVFFFWIHRNLMVLEHPDVSGMYGFWNIHRKCPD